MIEIDELDYKRLIERSTRINKAIEYIEILKDDNSRYYIENAFRDLLDILKGIDKDDRDSNNNDN